jgi:starch phosphorylase
LSLGLFHHQFLDYVRNYYGPAKRQGDLLVADNVAGASELARWKKKVAEAWPGVRMRFINPLPKAVNTGECMPIEVAVHLNGLSP